MAGCKHGTSCGCIRCLAKSREAGTDPGAWASDFSTASCAAWPLDAEPGSHPDGAVPAIIEAVVSQKV